MKTDCYTCKHRRSIPGDRHSSCSKPDFKMTGQQRGIDRGWFFYPFNFDPIWRTKECDNYERKE